MCTTMVSDDVLVSTTITSQGSPPQPALWWEGMTLDQQEELLDRIDPQNYGPGKPPPMARRKWNQEKRRIRRARERWMRELCALRKECHCRNCTRQKRPPFPRYYVANRISYECWLESQVVDPELDELIEPLRGNRDRIGSAIVQRASVEYSRNTH